MSYIRRASHLGEWYPNKEELEKMLKASFFYTNKDENLRNDVIGILSPHSCYSVCLRTAAHSYSRIDPNNYDKIFIFGTCHHIPLTSCLISNASELETPFGNLKVDVETCQNIYELSNSNVRFMTQEEDEAEHSLEMQFPIIKYLFEDKNIEIIPLLIGSLNENVEEFMANLLRPMILTSRTLFIISSDFTHWGELFHFTSFANGKKPLEQQLLLHDERAMNIISAFNYEHFRFHIEEISCSICGSFSICLILHILSSNYRFEKVYRSELSPIKSSKDFSISYVAAAFYPNSEIDNFEENK